ncbi:MAG: NAD(P)H-hydrate epimerase, partial [Pyrinomonadaceae bacterium]
MLKVLTAEQMREVDRLTTERYGIPSILLMENAAHAVARVITDKLGGSVEGKSILILCGPGNNGGDGAALARILWTQGANCKVILIGSIDQTRGDAKTNFELVRNLAGEQDYVYGEPELYFTEASTVEEYNRAASWFHEDLRIDAIFGTGLSRPVEGETAGIISKLSRFLPGERWTPIVSIDMPSGLHTEMEDWGARNILSVARPSITVTFTAVKPAQVVPPGARICGQLVTVRIGSPA